MNEKMMDEKLLFGNLLELYRAFLTKKQVEYMELYYQEDYSLQEIAELFGVTRVAIHNQLQHAQKKLLDFEKHLGLYDIYTEIVPELEKGLETTDYDMIARAIQTLKDKQNNEH